MSEDESECSACELGVALGTTLGICKKLGNDEKCQELMDKVIDGDIEPEEVFKTVREMVKGHEDESELMDAVDKFIEESRHGKHKGKKKGKSE